MNRINQKWEGITEPLFQILVQKAVVYTKANHGQWLTVGKALFDRLSESEPKELLERVLLAANLPVVSLPSHVMEGIATHSTFVEITAHVTRLVLKRVPACCKNLERREKLLLLGFCLGDCQFADLCELELLPLSSGAFTTFSNQGERIYISLPDHPRELLPGLRHRFVDETVGGDIIQKLKCAARQGKVFSVD